MVRKVPDIFSAEPDELTWEIVDAFLQERHPEDARIEYKRTLGDGVEESIAAMANTRGGVILVGVAEDKAKRPQLPIQGVSIGRHGGTLANLCYSKLQPVRVPRHKFIGLPAQPGQGVLVIQVRLEDAPPVTWHEGKGVLIRAGDADRPADLATLRTLLAAESERWEPAVETASEQLMHALSVSGPANATHVLVGALIRRGDGPQEDWTNVERKSLITVVKRYVQSAPDLQWLPRAGNVLVVRPEDASLSSGRPRIYIELDAVGFAMVRIGWKANPFPLAALLYGLSTGFALVMDPAVQEIYRPVLPLDFTLGLVNWPEKGIEPGYLIGALRLEEGTVNRAMVRVTRRYRLAPGAGWAPIAARFVDTVLGEAGYADYDYALPNLFGLAIREALSAAGLEPV